MEKQFVARQVNEGDAERETYQSPGADSVPEIQLPLNPWGH